MSGQVVKLAALSGSVDEGQADLLLTQRNAGEILVSFGHDLVGVAGAGMSRLQRRASLL